MYVIVKQVENNGIKHFSMLAANGTYTEDSLQKAIMFPTAAIATEQKDVLSTLNPDDVFIVKKIVLEDIQTND